MDGKIPPRKIRLDRHDALSIIWRDGSEDVYPVAYLRQKCPCATCREFRADRNPFRVLTGDMAETGAHVAKMTPVGHYALNFEFSDGHSTGIFSWEYLLEIAPRPAVP
jgi:DUF971 family protein